MVYSSILLADVVEWMGEAVVRACVYVKGLHAYTLTCIHEYTMHRMFNGTAVIASHTHTHN